MPTCSPPSTPCTAAAYLRPRVTITDHAEALSALQELYALFFTYLEHALQPLVPLVTRAALRAFILETRHEFDNLTARHALGGGYAETLTVTELGRQIAMILEIEGSPATAARGLIDQALGAQASMIPANRRSS